MHALLLALALSQAPATTESASEQAIRAIVAEQAAAWNDGDGHRYARHVGQDVSFTNIFGMVMHGRDAFERRHTEILASAYKGTRKVHVVRRLRLITPDVALVEIDNEVRGVRAMPGNLPVPADGVLKTQLLQVFVRRDGRWQVEAYHNVDVKAPPATPSVQRR